LPWGKVVIWGFALYEKGYKKSLTSVKRYQAEKVPQTIALQ